MKWRVLNALCMVAAGSSSLVAQPDGNVPFTIPGEIRGQVFAAEPMLRNPVALSVADDGKVYVTETTRRKSANLDIRANADWIEDELALETVADKVAFYRRELAPERSERNRRRVADHNDDGSHDWRDLTVLSERIHELRDEDGDGIADASSVFAADLRGITTEIAGGVLSHDGAVYATVAPDVWRFLDRDGDGVSDARASIANGFAVHVAYAGHNMHGLAMGPDGRLYWSIGDTGSDARPHEGAVFRCELDGSDFEVFARGLRNPQELAFDHLGNLFTGDNDADFGDRERWVHVVYGADYGWRFWWQYQRGDQWRAPDSAYSVWMEEKLWHPAFPGQAAYIVPGEQWIDNGPCGVTFNPGSGMGDAYRHTFFMAHFTGSTGNSSVRSYQLEPRGATYAIAQEAAFLGQAVVTGLDFAPDGSALFAADWSGSWPKNEQGRVYRLSHPNHTASAEVSEARAFLTADRSRMDEDALLAGLRHGNRNVRWAAHTELARRANGYDVLSGVALDAAQPRLARLSALWGMGIIARKGGAEPEAALALFSDSDTEVRAQAAALVGDVGFKQAESGLLALLEDSEPRVVFQAAMALASLNSERAVAPALRKLSAWGEGDRFLRHAGIRILERGATGDALARLSGHGSADVRLAAAVALRRQESPAVTAFVSDVDPLVAIEAARAINDVPILEARAALAEALEQGPRGEAWDRRALNANFRQGDEAAARRVLALAEDREAADAVRIEALRLLRHWERPSPRDRVCGGWFDDIDAENRFVGPEFRERIAERFDGLLTGSSEVQDAAAALLEALGAATERARLESWAFSDSSSIGLRRGALRLLRASHPEGANAAARSFLETLVPELVEEGVAVLSALDPDSARASAIAMVEGAAPIRVKQAALRGVRFLDKAAREALSQRWALQLRSGALDPGLGLEALELGREDIKGGTGASWDESIYLLHGGDAERGAVVFVNKVELQCLRCHRATVGDQVSGGTMGPSLVGLGARRDRAHVLASILDPNAEIASGFATALFTLRSGESVYGQILRDTETQVIVGIPALSDANEGAEAGAMVLNERPIDTADIASRSPGVSGMPPGLANLMSPFELRDLIEFVASQ